MISVTDTFLWKGVAVTAVEIVVAIAIAVGMLGILVPVLPGVLLVLAAIVVWATELQTRTGWLVCAVAVLFLAVGAVAKYAVPGRQLKNAGIPATTQWAGVALGVAGFFVIPVVGLFLGFVVGMYLAEWRRLGAGAAWPSTRAALGSLGLMVLIEFASAVLAAATWAVGVVVT